MDFAHKELLVARISSGVLRCRVETNSEPLLLTVRHPTREQRYIAQEVYAEAYQDAQDEGLYDETELLEFMMDNGLWTDEDQKLVDNLPKEIEEFKVKLFGCTFRSKERRSLKKAVARAKGVLDGLLTRRNEYSNISCVGVASLARARYLMSVSLFFQDGRQAHFCDGDNHVIDAAMSCVLKNRLKEAEYRELARTEPWRSLWVSRKACGGLFGDASDLTEEQRTLISWSSLYDNVYEHPHCPADEAVEDDDVLDGWLIIQRRERNKNQIQTKADGLSDRVKNSGEVYILAETPEDAAQIEALNDVHAQAVKRQREKAIQAKGMVGQLEMPDTMREIQMALTRRAAERISG